MKTLLIDNYDSFTFNLFQDLAVVNGCEPLVVRNDEYSWEQLKKFDFDNIVISPGPGRPDRAEDFGVCTDAIRHAEVPVLGVCLGHQGIAAAFGARVQRAPEPMHGRMSEVVHQGHALFDGLPSPFSAVRYHSLVVDTELSPELRAIAWVLDSTLIMGVCHVSRPIWGVQFHPESILTKDGRTILENFKRLSASYMAGTGQKISNKQASRSATSAHGNIEQRKSPFRLEVRCLDSMPDAEALYTALYGQTAKAFWLDSSLIRAEYSRFSYMGDASGPHSEVLTYDLTQETLKIDRHGQTETLTQSVFEYLEVELSRRSVVDAPNLPFDFIGGFVGYFGYELYQETLLCHRRTKEQKLQSAEPAASWIFADRILVLDHLEKKTYLLRLEPAKGEGPGKKESAWEDYVQSVIADLQPTLQLSSQCKDGEVLSARLRHSPKMVLKQIQACQDLIRAGESYELCLTNQISAASDSDPFVVYRALRSINPAPFGAYLNFSDFQVMCSSPERFLKIASDGLMEAKPIKGTIARGTTPEEDEARKQELLQSEKDQAENLMIVDLLRNDLGSVAEIGSIEVPKLMEIESFATVHQMVSTVRGQLRQSLPTLHAVRAAFPGGSMTGAPKKRSVEILERMEEGSRGIYSGAIGYLSLSNAIDLNIVIRTLVASNGEYSIGAGGAIISMSDPDSEVEEMLLKAQASLRALALAHSGREEFELKE